MSHWFEILARKFYLHMKRIAPVDDEPDRRQGIYQKASSISSLVSQVNSTTEST